MIIDGESDGDDEKTPAEKVPEGNAYLESMVSVEGFTRGPHGRVKFNKDTKKRRREQENLDGDVEMENIESSAKSKQIKPRKGLKPGHEFKAKVSSDFPSSVERSCSIPSRNNRKREVISREGVLILAHTYRSLKLRKRLVVAVMVGSVLLAGPEC